MRKIAEAFRALGDETRLRILTLLCHAELCVCEIELILKLPQPRVSRHLGILKDAGLIGDRRDGQMVFYHLVSSHPIWTSAGPGIKQLLGDFAAPDDILRLQHCLRHRREGKEHLAKLRYEWSKVEIHLY
ncbi:MAG: metalloregulator ArsR/SmtB family transcription factor [Bacillota bacterium]|jgi:DNA-binding transcriptional ArsR family regulator|nr:metalloregulator ArsR/SmtB family transcription factor [Bacillota bacterium]